MLKNTRLDYYDSPIENINWKVEIIKHKLTYILELKRIISTKMKSFL
jgi:hypothetical protein